MNIFSYTEKKEKIFNYLPWFFVKKNQWTNIQVNNWKKHNNRFIVHVKNIDDRSKIHLFTNASIIINRANLPTLQQQEYYWNDIISYKVFNTNEHYIGVVINLIRTKNNDVLVIQNQKSKLKETTLIPFVKKKIIKNINVTFKIIIVQWN